MSGRAALLVAASVFALGCVARHAAQTEPVGAVVPPATDGATAMAAARIEPEEQIFEWSDPADSVCAEAADAGASPVESLDAAPSASRVSNVTQVVASMRPRFRGCYMALLRKDPSAQGKVLLRLQLNCHGRVVAIHATVRGLGAETVECILAQARSHEFAPGSEVIVEVPVSFVR